MLNMNGTGLIQSNQEYKGSTCQMTRNDELNERQILPNIYKDVIEYFKEKMFGSYIKIVGTFGISNTLYYSDIDLNLYSKIGSLDLLYTSLQSLRDTGDTGYIYSDLKIGNEHFDKDELDSERFIKTLNDLVLYPKLIKHDIIFYDGSIYREASFFLEFTNDSDLRDLNIKREVVPSIREAFLLEYESGNYIKSIKRLLSLSKALNNNKFIDELLQYIDSEYNLLSMILSGIDCLRLVKMHLDPEDEDIDNVTNELLFLYESIRMKDLPSVSNVRNVLYSTSDDLYVNLIDNIKHVLNNNLGNNMLCRKIDLMTIFRALF
jgi:hypothetical protein